MNLSEKDRIERDLRQERTRLLAGDAGLERLRNAHILILGVGGVGAYAAEQIARAGVGRITLVDGDRVEPTNCNRQLPALTQNFGRPKAEVVAERLRQINPFAEITGIVEFLRDSRIDELLDDARYDYAIDAIDSLSPKVFFLMGCRKRKIPVISSMGSGGKTAPELIQIADISRTHGCALARAVRKRLAGFGVTRGIKTVFSPEEVPRSAIRSWQDEEGRNHSTVGTLSCMPAAFGTFCASLPLRALAFPPESTVHINQ